MKKNRMFFICFFWTILALAPSLAFGQKTFHQNLTHRPRLTFDGRDQAHIKRFVQRIKQGQQPWLKGYKSLVNKAKKRKVIHHSQSGWKKKSDRYVALYSQEGKNGRLAAAWAALAWLEQQGLNPAWTGLSKNWLKKKSKEAWQVLAQMYRDWPAWKIRHNIIGRGIVAADSLLSHCLAYDFLMALPSSYRPGKSTIRKAEDNLAELASDLYFWYFTVDYQKNNHGIRVVSALGVAGLTLNHYNRGSYWKSPRRWVKKVIKEMHPIYGDHSTYQMKSGAYAEGSSYYHYAADIYLPFAYSYLRFLSGQGVPFLKSDLYSKVTRWMVNLRLPDGRRPSVDNSRYFKDMTPAFFLSRLPSGVKSQKEQLAFLWDWKDAGYTGMGGRRNLYLLSAVDPTSTQLAQVQGMSRPGAKDSMIMKKEGQAVLRSGWGRDDAYLMVNGEYGSSRTHGSGHESVDNGSYTYYLHRDFAVIAPGYDGWPNVTKTNRGRHQSIVLVDGKGPRPAYKPWIGRWRSGGTDAFLQTGSRTKITSEVSSIEVTSEYKKGRIRRTFLMVGKRYMVIEDQLKAKKQTFFFFFSKTSPRSFTSLIQTATRPKNSKISKSGTKVTYYTRKKQLPVCVNAVSSQGLKAQLSKNFDSNGDYKKGQHHTIGYETKKKVKEATILTAIAVNPAGQSMPEVTSLKVKKKGFGSTTARGLKIKSGGKTDLVISNPKGQKVKFSTPLGTAMTTKSRLVIFSFSASGQKKIYEVK